VKPLIILALIVGIFGGAAYFAYDLFLKPQKQLAEEKLQPPPPPPPDPTLPEYEKCLALQKSGDVLGARDALNRFIGDYPHSSKADEAKDRLGEINIDFFLSSKPAPEKQLYVVKSGDVLTRVAAKLKTTPELIMRANNLSGTMLRIDQKLMISPPDFAVAINKKEKRVTLLNQSKFFKHYPIRSLPVRPASAKPAAAAPGKTTGKITDKIAWSEAGSRVSFSDKEYATASHWIVFSISGNTLYSQPDEESGQKVTKPPTGLGMAPEHMEELAVLLSKGNPVTIE
jgi:LysM repeat protein